MNELSILEIDAKADLRKLAMQKRKKASIMLGDVAGNLVAVHFLRSIEIPNGQVVAGYWPIGHEMDVLPLLKQLMRRGHHACLPVTLTAGSPLVFQSWTEETVMAEGPYGIKVPQGGRNVSPDVLLVPLLGFDRNGHRLGYGKGFYDVTLEYLRAEKKVLAIGIAYKDQEFDYIAQEAHDQKLDWVVTEDYAIQCGRK